MLVQIAVATVSGNSLRQTVHTHCASVHQAAKLVAALCLLLFVNLSALTGEIKISIKGCGGNCRPGGNWKVMTAYRRVYDSRHLQADCQEPESAPEPYAR